MARLNVEDSLWSDPRFLKLCVKLGDEIQATGMIIIAWKLAQKFWCPEKQLIPELTFKEAGLSEMLVTVGLVDRLPHGIRIRGCEEHFAWWFKNHNKGVAGGKASAEARRKTHGSAVPHNASNYPHATEADPEQNPNDSEQPEPSSSSSPSSSFSKNNYNCINTARSMPENVDNSRNPVDNSKSEDSPKTRREVAKMCLRAIKEFGPHEGSKIRERVGESIFKMVNRHVGWQSIRQMPENAWTEKNLAEMFPA